MHQFADRLMEEISVPLIHIAETTAQSIKKDGLSIAGLLGTKHTMEMDFYTAKLIAKGITPLILYENNHNIINTTIFNELLKNQFKSQSKEKLLRIIQDLKNLGAEGIILGCTEIPLLVKQEDVSIPFFDTLKIHVKAIVEFGLKE